LTQITLYTSVDVLELHLAVKADLPMSKRKSKPTVSPVEFIDRVIKLDEKGEPFKLAPYQRRVLEMALRRDPSGDLVFRLVVLSEPKKSGKTFIAACLVLWWAVTNPHTEIIITANDLEQSISRVFKTATALIEHNEVLSREAQVLSSSIRMQNGTLILPIASDYKGAAGSRHSLVVYDELWGFETERARRLYEELTPPPTERSAWVLIVTYAGFTGESDLLESIYQRGMAGRRVDQELECYENDELFMFWSHTPRQPWQDQKYYDQQRKILRPAQFSRLHENRWVSSDSRFIDPELWDRCYDPELKPATAGDLFIGIDASVKHDSTALVAVKYDKYSDDLILATHRIWHPSPDNPMDFEATIEFFLRHLENYSRRIEKVLCDPFQLHRTMMTLEQAGIPIEAFPQTLPNLTLATESLYSRLANRRLRVYNAPDLREHVLNAASVETSRGLRLSKEKQSLKIDGAVALSFAIVAAEQAGVPANVDLGFIDDIEVLTSWDYRRRW
jgi:phage terminase large subunit-like protein